MRTALALGERRPPPTARQLALPRLLLVAACYVLLVAGAGARGLWSAGEGRSAQIVANYRTEPGLAPRLFTGAALPEHPPLYDWLATAAAAALGSVDGWSLRWPALIAATAAILLTFELGWRWKDIPFGLIAGVTLLCCTRFAWFARVGRPDAPLLLVTAVCLWQFWRTQERPLRGFDPRLALGWGIGSAVAGLLVGWQGVALVGLPALVWMFGPGRRRERRHTAHRQPLREVLLGLTLGGAALAAWRIAVRQEAAPDVVEQTGWDSLGAWNDLTLWMPAPRLVLDCFPWSPLVLVAAYDYWKRRRELLAGPDGRRRGFLLTTLAVQLAFLAVFGEKRVELLAPLLPPLVLLFVDWLEERRRRFLWKREVTVAYDYVRASRRAVVSAIVVAAVAAPLLFWAERQFLRKGGLAKAILRAGPFQGRLNETDAFMMLRVEQVLRQHWPLLGIVLASAVVGVGLAHAGWHQRRNGLLISGLAVPWAVCYLLQVQVLLPRLDGLRDMERFGRTIRHIAEPDRPVIFFGAPDPDLAFHVGKPAVVVDDWDKLVELGAGQTPIFVVLKTNQARSAEKDERLRAWKEVANNCAFGLHREPRSLLTNRPAASAQRLQSLPDSLWR